MQNLRELAFFTDLTTSDSCVLKNMTKIVAIIKHACFKKTPRPSFQQLEDVPLLVPCNFVSITFLDINKHVNIVLSCFTTFC